MHAKKLVGKRDFIQHTSNYLKWVEQQDKDLIITHHGKPDLIITKVKTKSFKELRGLTDIKIHADINEHVLSGYDEW